MLTLRDPRHDHNCQGLARRDFLKIGALGFGGLLGLPQLLAAKAQGATLGKLVQDRSVVLLFLQGGPSHIEFFDPKMTAPAEIRSITGEVADASCRASPSAARSRSWRRWPTSWRSSARTARTTRATPTKRSPTGGNPLKAAMGAIYARVAGANHPTTGMPTNILVLPEAVQDGLKLGSNFETGACPR